MQEVEENENHSYPVSLDNALFNIENVTIKEAQEDKKNEEPTYSVSSFCVIKTLKLTVSLRSYQTILKCVSNFV